MHSALSELFSIYPKEKAPFLHRQLADWSQSQPLKGLRVVNHVPLFKNTVTKIACLVEAGAHVTATNPNSFCTPDPKALAYLEAAEIPYEANLGALSGQHFDLYFDCGAELYCALGRPKIGAIELTGSGDMFYRAQKLDFPVISIDRSRTKQLEAVFGCAEGSSQALFQLIGPDATKNKAWLIFGFGKIGRGLAYFCKQNGVRVEIADIDAQKRQQAEQLGLRAVDPAMPEELSAALNRAEIVLTATGIKSALDSYPSTLFSGKTLVNLGIYDEFGGQFGVDEVLNEKKPINFILPEPTPIEYIDPELYLHNQASLLVKKDLHPGVHDVPYSLDEALIQDWCGYHQFDQEVINQWFIASPNETENLCLS